LIVIGSLGFCVARSANGQGSLFLEPSPASLLPSVQLSDVQDMRLVAILSALEALGGVRPVNDSAYVAAGASDVLIMPLSPYPFGELTLLYDRAEGEHLLLLRDQPASGHTEAHLWSTGEDEILITEVGIRLLAHRSPGTFRLTDGVGVSGGSSSGWLSKLKCYLKAAGLTQYTFSSFKAFLSRGNFCSALNGLTLVTTAISCVTSFIPPNPGDIFNCTVGLATILTCPEYFKCGGATVNSVWTGDGNVTTSQFTAGAPIYYYGNVTSVSGADVAANLAWSITGPCDSGVLWSGMETVTNARPDWGLQRTAPSCAGSFTYTLTASAGGNVSSQSVAFQVAGCDPSAYSIDSSDLTVPPGGSGSFKVNAPAGCGWTSTVEPPDPSDPSEPGGLITIQSGAAGSGNGTVGFSVAGCDSDGDYGAIDVLFPDGTLVGTVYIDCG
jgi:hypothetical protein